MGPGRVESVGEPFQVAGQKAEGGAGFLAHLRDDEIVDVCDAVAHLDFDVFDHIFDAAGEIFYG